MKKVIRFFSILIILSGLGFVCYPSFASYINQRYMNVEISDYDKEMEQYSDQKVEEMIALARKYNEGLPGSYPADPFSGENITDFTGTDMEHFFMVQTGEIIGYVEIPSIDVYLPIYYGTQEEELEKGAGLVVNTSLPVGGKGTHSVISAHTGLAVKRLFTDLVKVEEGDVFFIHVLNLNLAYQVDQIKVVLPDQTEDLLIERDKDYVTLLTCTPFGINDHRLLVRGEHIDYDFSKKDNSMDWKDLEKKKDLYLWVIVLSVFGIIVVISMTVKIVKKLKKRRGTTTRGKGGTL